MDNLEKHLADEHNTVRAQDGMVVGEGETTYGATVSDEELGVLHAQLHEGDVAPGHAHMPS
jgi:hypothetical protein